MYIVLKIISLSRFPLQMIRKTIVCETYSGETTRYLKRVLHLQRVLVVLIGQAIFRLIAHLGHRHFDMQS